MATVVVLNLPCFSWLRNYTMVLASRITAAAGGIIRCCWCHTCCTASRLWPIRTL